MKDISGQISLFDLKSFLGCQPDAKQEPPVLLESGQTLYIVKKGDVRTAKVLDENWVCNEDNRGYRLQYDDGCYDCVWNSNLESVGFRNLKDAKIKAEKFLSEHDVIRAEDIHPIYVAAYQYVRECDGRTMTAFYCELDNGMAYFKDFVTYHYMVCVDKKKNAVKKFYKQQEFQYNDVKQVDYEPVFKNMYRICQKYDWDYSEAGHSYSVG